MYFLDRKQNKGRTGFNLTSAGIKDRLRPATSKHQFILKDPALPSIDHLIFSAKQRSKNEESFKEELALLKALWDDLGVRDNYRKAFESTVRQYEESLRTELINLEREEMLRVKESLTVSTECYLIQHIFNRNSQKKSQIEKRL